MCKCVMISFPLLYPNVYTLIPLMWTLGNCNCNWQGVIESGDLAPKIVDLQFGKQNLLVKSLTVVGHKDDMTFETVKPSTEGLHSFKLVSDWLLDLCSMSAKGE